jgi:hypothetical protein
MKVFLSWSKDRSRLVAEALAEWLQEVVQSIDPFFSPELPKGTTWLPELMEELNTSRAGIVCVTPENAQEPWLNFEAGALAKVVGTTCVVPYLVDIIPTDLEPPLGMLNAAVANQIDTWRMVETLNKRSERSIRETTLRSVFDRAWPDLEAKLSAIDVPPILSSTPIWSSIPRRQEIGREEAIYRGADHRVPA